MTCRDSSARNKPRYKQKHFICWKTCKLKTISSGAVLSHCTTISDTHLFIFSTTKTHRLCKFMYGIFLDGNTLRCTRLLLLYLYLIHYVFFSFPRQDLYFIRTYFIDIIFHCVQSLEKSLCIHYSKFYSHESEKLLQVLRSFDQRL